MAEKKFKKLIVAQLAEQLPLTSEINGSNHCLAF